MSEAAATPPPWRILSWNIRGNHSPDLTAIAEVIAGWSPDVVALQEVRRTQAGRLGTELGWRHRWARKHHPLTPLVWWRSEGHALLTPHELVATSSRTISPGVSTWSHRHRIVLAGTVQRGADPLRVYDTHLAAQRQPDERIAQARRAASIVRADAAANPSRPSPPAVVAGDLNAPGEQEVIREFHAAGLRDPGGGPTHPATVPRRRLDYILVPEGSAITDRLVPAGGDEWAELSDHLPVLLGFTPPR